MQNAECRIAPHGALTVRLFPPPLWRCYRRDTACRVRPFFTPESLFLAPLKGNSPNRGNFCEADKRVPVSGGKAGFCEAKDWGVYLFHLYILLAFHSTNTHSAISCPPWKGGWHPQDDGRVYLSHLYILLPFTRLTLMPLWHILCPERQRMQSALFLWTQLVIFRIYL